MSKRKLPETIRSISEFFTKKPRPETSVTDKENVDPKSPTCPDTTEIETFLIEAEQLATPTSTSKGQRKSGVDQKWKTDFPWILESSDGNSMKPRFLNYFLTVSFISIKFLCGYRNISMHRIETQVVRSNVNYRSRDFTHVRKRYKRCLNLYAQFKEKN